MNQEMNIREEESLLLELCRLEFSDKQLMKIQTLVASVTDWNYFCSLANAHGVAALVWYNLEKQQLLFSITNEVIAFFRGTLMKSLSRNTFNTESIIKVLKLLNDKDIKTVLLKGLVLENTVYGNSGLRQMSDVDVLINREQCMIARSILIRNGYVSLPVKSVFHELILEYTGKHLPSLFKNGASVEIHHELFGDRKNDMTRLLFESSYETEIIGERTYFPKPQIFFLYLVRHLHMHELNNDSQLRLYTDLVVLIEKYRNEIINPDLLKYASQAGISEILANRMIPLRDLWGVTFPGWMDDFIIKFHNPEFLSMFLFFLKSPKDNLPLNKAAFYRQVINDIPGFHRKFLFILGDIFPKISFMKKRYSCKRTWEVLLYYPHRIGKIWWLIKK
jgi:hypothetical protein